MLVLCFADLPVQMHVCDCGGLSVLKLLDPVQPLVDSVSHLVQLHIHSLQVSPASDNWAAALQLERLHSMAQHKHNVLAIARAAMQEARTVASSAFFRIVPVEMKCTSTLATSQSSNTVFSPTFTQLAGPGTPFNVKVRV